MTKPNAPIKHIIWFAYYDEREPSVRYRGKYALEYIHTQYSIGYTIVYPKYSLSFVKNFLIALCKCFFTNDDDTVIVFENIRTNGVYSNVLKVLLRYTSKRTIYDIDDADYLRFPPETINYFMKNVNYCTVGSSALKEYALKCNPNVSILTSPIIVHDNVKKHTSNMFKEYTIGWIGYYGAHKDSLYELLFPVLRSVKFKVRLVLLGVQHQSDLDSIIAYFKGCSNISVEAPLDIDWLDEPSIYSYVCQFDIGVSPLLNTEFNRAKSAFKLKQYMSCGIPVIGSSTGENSTFIHHGINGYLCHDYKDFEYYLNEMAKLDKTEYHEMSQRALETLPLFSMSSYCSKLVSLSSSLCEEKHKEKLTTILERS